VVHGRPTLANALFRGPPRQRPPPPFPDKVRLTGRLPCARRGYPVHGEVTLCTARLPCIALGRSLPDSGARKISPSLPPPRPARHR
jgi:hypothetical protein